MSRPTLPLCLQDPVGVFDSGVGGLSVLREIRRQLPQENLLYVADSGHAPYGDRPVAYIQARCVAVLDFLLSRQVKAVVVACNTATGAAIDLLRARSPVPVVAIEPAIKPAAVQTQSGVIGVLATSQTLASASVSRLMAAHGQGLRVLLQACPGLVEQVERAALNEAATLALLRSYVVPLVAQGADTLVLGCTHYPFLRQAIQDIAGPDVRLIDPAPAVALQLARRLQADGLGHPAPSPDGAGAVATVTHGTTSFWSSGALAQAQRTMAALWQDKVTVQALPATHVDGFVAPTPYPRNATN